ncbi:MAG: hypothetical protein IT178_07105 [Acidobacteria bacterium]|nr:hypothetical protein [Acidobacteriota bacterium]
MASLLAATDAWAQADEVVYYHTDTIGSVRATTDAAERTQNRLVPYARPSGATTKAQRASVQGKPCIDCGMTTSRQVDDHRKPLVKEHYETGAIDKRRMRDPSAVQPQCPTCSAKQGAELSRYSREQRKKLLDEPK